MLFNYQKGRGQNGSKELLAHYHGYLQCDVYMVYNKIVPDLEITLAGCMVHARLKFHDELDSDEKRVQVALGLWRKIYVEKRIIKEETSKDLEIRRELLD